MKLCSIEGGGAGCLDSEGYVVRDPEYDYSTDDKDWALIFLPSPITDIDAIALNDDPDVPVDNDELTTIGWGDTNPDRNVSVTPNILQEVTVNYISNEACTRPPYDYYDDEITPNMLCAAAPGKDSCQGDSGTCILFLSQAY